MRRFRILVIALLLAVAAGGTLAAHHSAAQFDFSKSVAISGVVVKFIAINPHMQLVLRVSDAKGTRDVEFEGHSTNNMYRAGYRDKMIKVGDRITVYAAPLRSGLRSWWARRRLDVSGPSRARAGSRSSASTGTRRRAPKARRCSRTASKSVCA